MSLIDKSVCIYTDGGFVLDGVIVKQDGNAVYIEVDGEVYMVFREKVSFIKLSSGKPKSESAMEEDAPKETGTPSVFPQNGMTYEERFESIPLHMLNMEAKDDDFSVFFGSKGNMSFSSGEDK